MTNLYPPAPPEMPGGARRGDVPYTDVISLQPLARVWWSYRRVIAAGICAALALFVVGALAAFLRQPLERHARVEFRLLFDGADEGTYPNGLPFSRSEILGAPVLLEVYEANQLSRYCTFDEFRNRLFILESNRELELLSFEYLAKLSDARLTPIERAQLEDEYRQRREALRVPQYSLDFMTPGGATPIPNELMSKLLNDVLTAWAEQAASRKGALRYQVEVLSVNTLQREFASEEDFLVRVDILRGKIGRILQNIGVLSDLPGASVIRVGDSNLSLGEIRANLQDVLRFKVEPLIGLIRATGTSQDPSLLRRYVGNRLLQVQLDKEAAQRRVQLLQEALARYVLERGSVAMPEGQSAPGASQIPAPGGSLIPQVSESFLDRLVEMSSQTEDMQFRQELTNRIIFAGQEAVELEREAGYYAGLNQSVQSLPVSGRITPEALEEIEQRLDDIYNETAGALKQVNLVYEQLSAQNLNPRTSLYRVTSAYSVSTIRPLTFRELSLYGALVLLAALIVMPLAALLHYYLKREVTAGERAEAHKPGSSAAPDAVAHSAQG